MCASCFFYAVPGTSFARHLLFLSRVFFLVLLLLANNGKWSLLNGRNVRHNEVAKSHVLARIEASFRRGIDCHIEIPIRKFYIQNIKTRQRLWPPHGHSFGPEVRGVVLHSMAHIFLKNGISLCPLLRRGPPPTGHDQRRDGQR